MSEPMPLLFPSDLKEGNKKDLNRFTFARINLGRTGIGIPLKEVLAFRAAHAAAKDAIFNPFDVVSIREQLTLRGMESVELHSAAQDTATYLQRPDLGRILDEKSTSVLQQLSSLSPDLVFIVADGLSAKAVNTHAVSLLYLLMEKLQETNLKVAPITLLHKGRVAASDPIGEYLNARLSIMLIGERPGLSSPDSMGAYLTYSPRIGLTDEMRNCISNIRWKGLSYSLAADKLFYLINQSFKKGISGVGLKDEMGLID